jgi:hypothetical protein
MVLWLLRLKYSGLWRCRDRTVKGQKWLHFKPCAQHGAASQRLRSGQLQQFTA